MSAFAFLLAARQLGQEGDCGFLIQTATSAPNNTRGLAFDHAPGTLSFNELMDKCREGVCA